MDRNRLFSSGLIAQWGHILLNFSIASAQGWSAIYNFHVTFNGWGIILLQARNQNEIVLGAEYVNNSQFKTLATNHSEEERHIYGIWWLAMGN